MAMGSPGFHASTVTPKIICDLGVSSICMRGSSLGSFESRSSRRPSRGWAERAAGNWTVIVCAEAEATIVSKNAKRRIMKYTNFRLCPGHIRASGGSVCPDGTSYFRAPAIFVGHFQHRVSAEALVTGEGCEPH